MKKTINQLTNDIDSYIAKSAPLSIDPPLDGGIKKNILETLNNKASSKPHLYLASIPSEDLPTNILGENGHYYIQIVTGSIIVYLKSAGVWSAIEQTNDMFFYNDDDGGIRRYYSLSDDLTNAVLVHSIDFSDISGASVKYTEQNLTQAQQLQARTNILAASIAYVDNQIASLRKSGVFGTECAGSTKWHFGLESTIPANWAKIPSVQTWYSKSEYPQLYIALGGESNPWGVTSTQFSLPYFSDGSFLNKAGTGYPLAGTGGEKEHALTIAELPAHSFKVANGGRDDGDIDGDRVIAKNVGLGGNSSYRLRGNSGVADSGKTNTIGEGKLINNMPPYVSAFLIIKLIDADPGEVMDADLPYRVYSTTDLSASGEILVGNGIFIKDINIFVLTGTPSVEVVELGTSQMSGQDVYPITANYKSTGSIHINMTGAGSIRVKIIKFN